LHSGCDDVRFGSEFCEWKMPNLHVLRKAYNLTNDSGKGFSYITPRVTDTGIKKIREHLGFLKEKGEIKVIINDLGVLNVLRRYTRLKPHLGRQLVYTPARCPWPGIDRKIAVISPLSVLAWKLIRKQAEDLYSQTSLNYDRTIKFFQEYGIQGVDVDWISRCFEHYSFLIKNGLNLSVHLHLVPVTITRKCHTARFLGETNLENCSKPCYRRAFLLKPSELGIELLLSGNVVFRFTNPSKSDVKKLAQNIAEFVISMNSASRIQNSKEVDKLILDLKNGKSY